MNYIFKSKNFLTNSQRKYKKKQLFPNYSFLRHCWKPHLFMGNLKSIGVHKNTKNEKQSNGLTNGG